MLNVFSAQLILCISGEVSSVLSNSSWKCSLWGYDHTLHYRDEIYHSHSSNPCPDEGTMGIYTFLIYKRTLKGLMNSLNIFSQFLIQIHYLEFIICSELWSFIWDCFLFFRAIGREHYHIYTSESGQTLVFHRAQMWWSSSVRPWDIMHVQLNWVSFLSIAGTFRCCKFSVQVQHPNTSTNVLPISE